MERAPAGQRCRERLGIWREQKTCAGQRKEMMLKCRWGLPFQKDSSKSPEGLF